METEKLIENGVSKLVAVTACASMAIFYVAILYFPTLILRLPPSPSLKSFMIRRFICAAISSLVSIFVSSLILLHIRNWEFSHLIGVYGIRVDHFWQAVAFPLLLTSLMYAGSLIQTSIVLVNSWKENENFSWDCIYHLPRTLSNWIESFACNVLAWRNYVVAPLTEELVFRACMIPLLICGGFRIDSIIFMCPLLFSFAHLNHFYELYCHQNYRFMKALLGVGLQLGYTMIFGSYASFMFIRTGHLVAPFVAHVFCNFMGLPVIFSQRNGMAVMAAFVAGLVGFLWLLFPLTQPELYNDALDNCSCWHGYCSWN